MGKYISINDILNTFKRLRDFKEKGFINDDLINTWITEAEAIIDAKISRRYKLPLEAIPDIIKSIALELTEYFAEKEIHTPTSSGDEVSWLYPRYDRIMKILDDISIGNLLLTDSNGEPLPVSKQALNFIQSNHRNIKQIFSMSDFELQEVDENYGKDE